MQGSWLYSVRSRPIVMARQITTHSTRLARASISCETCLAMSVRLAGQFGRSAASHYNENMWTQNLITFACLFFLFPSISLAQKKARSVVLPESTADQVKQLCSRPGPPKFDGAWTPTDADIRSMENRLMRISRLRSKSGMRCVRIEHPDRHYRQYIGIIINKRKFIFINAFCDDTPPANWQEIVIDICDGGCSWGVIYDIVTGKFSDLEMNGFG